MVNIELIEKCERKVVKYILDNLDNIKYRIIKDINYDPKEKMREYLKILLHSKNCQVKQIYSNKFGERYFSKNYGIQTMLREFRHSLFQFNYYDVDIVNCHPILLFQYCVKNKIHSCNELLNYINNRNKIFNELKIKGFDKDNIKIELLKIMNGGNMSSEYEDTFGKLNIEMKEIQKLVMLNNKDIYMRVKKQKKEKNNFYNIEGSVLNHLLCKLENTVLMSAFDFFKKNNYNVGALCFDGLMIEKTKDLNLDILKCLSDYVMKETGYKLTFIIKEMNEGLNIDINQIKDEQECIIIEHDEEGAQIIYKQITNDIVMSQNRIFIRKINNTNIYEEDVSYHFEKTKLKIQSIILSMNICKVKNKDSIIYYSKDIIGLERLTKTTFILLSTYSDDSFINKIWNSNIYKLCFLNGYYDFKNKIFISNYDNVYTTKYVNSNYNDNVSIEDMNKLNEYIINPILYEETTRVAFLNWCARGLAGCYLEKQWAIGLGYRNSGKSVLTDLFQESFNDYVGIFNAEELCCTRIGTGDIAKKLGWIIPFQFRRLNFSNELKSVDENGRSIKLDGNLIKSISSGGDEKIARTNYKDEMKFKIQGRMCLFMNDLIETDPIDATETLQLFEFKTIFKDNISEHEININNDQSNKTKFFQKDDNIKLLLKQQNIKDAFIKLIINSYSDIPIRLDNKNDLVENSNDAENIIKESFNITLNKNNKILINNFNEICKQSESLCKLSKSKIKFTLNKLGITEIKITENKESHRYYCGLIKK